MLPRASVPAASASPGSALATAPPRTPAADIAARRAVVTGLAQGLKLLADHVLPHANAAVEVAELAARAEQLAAAAWQQSAARSPDPAGARALAESFQAFVAEAAELSSRAARSAAATRDVGATMTSHAGALSNFATGSGPSDIAALRAALRPVVASLEQLPRHLAESRAMAGDVAGLGAKAVELGARAANLQANARPASATALEIYRSLRILGDEAATLAGTMQADSERVRNAIAGIASQAGRLATAGQDAAPPFTAASRIGAVVTQGRTLQEGAMDWGTGTRRA